MYSSQTKTRKKFPLLLGALLLGFLSASSITTANAGTAYSSTGYYTIAGKQYANQAIIQTNNGYARATNQTWGTNGTPAGWAGAQGRLFTSGGSLSCQGSMTYNPTANNTAVGFSCTRLTGGSWYSYGVSQGWNGSGYTSFYSYQSPTQNS